MNVTSVRVTHPERKDRKATIRRHVSEQVQVWRRCPNGQGLLSQGRMPLIHQVLPYRTLYEKAECRPDISDHVWRARFLTGAERSGVVMMPRRDKTDGSTPGQAGAFGANRRPAHDQHTGRPRPSGKLVCRDHYCILCSALAARHVYRQIGAASCAIPDR